MWDMTCPLRSAADVGQRSECAMVMSVTTQTIFPFMSDAHRPAVDVQMAALDTCVSPSFWLILSAILIGGDGYRRAVACGPSSRIVNITCPVPELRFERRAPRACVFAPRKVAPLAQSRNSRRTHSTHRDVGRSASSRAIGIRACRTAWSGAAHQPQSHFSLGDEEGGRHRTCSSRGGGATR